MIITNPFIRFNYIFLIFFLLPIKSWGTEPVDSLNSNIKKNWSFGGVPAIAYDSDVGFRYGIILKIFNYGDGSTYPQYKDQVFIHWSQTTKGSGNNELSYDSYSLIKNVRSLLECSYLTEQTLDFYGFNGYESNYNSALENKTNSNYLSSLFYKMDRRMLRLKSDFQGNMPLPHFKWLAGFTFNDIKLDTVDIKTLNKGKKATDKYPAANGGLYGLYSQEGLLPKDEISGGKNYIFKLGLIHDTRDNEANPMNGVWSDIQLLIAPDFIGNQKGFIRMSVTHRQYFTLVPKKLSLTYRLSMQNKLAGTIPFYYLPFVHYLAPYSDQDGLGGMKTLRGILRNRVVGDGVAYGNLEFRWKFYRTVLAKQNIYLALTSFLDGGLVTQKYKLQNNSKNTVLQTLISNEKEKLHLSAGAGFHFVMNENFIISADYGQSFDKHDGISGLYIGIGFLY